MLHELNQIMDYIETHLTEELSLEEIATYAGVSDFHFRKLFFFLSNMTLSEYVRNRRLSEANKDLLQGEKVTEVAYKYGYESVDGFTRAFKMWSGFLPSEAQKNKISKTVSKFTFIIDVRGGISMDVRIEEKEAFHLVGVSKRVPLQFEGVNQEIVKMAQSITESQRKKMHELQNVAPMEIVNASWDSDTDFIKEEGELTHLIGVLSTEGQDIGDLTAKAIPASTWAVFPSEGPFPETLQNTMAKIYSEWLPTANYEILDIPSFSFTKMKSTSTPEAYSEVWVAVKEMSK